jgi:dTDP-4-dehydrorhamnose reductase
VSGILLTGAGGQVGWEVTRRARARGLVLHGFGRATLDITDATAVSVALDAHAPAVVVNAAAYTAVDRAEAEEAQALAVNRDGPALLARACAARGILLIHLSTDYVFDGALDRPYREDDRTAPLGAYGRSKLAGEEAVRAATGRHVILRTSGVFGVHGANFVKTMLRLGKERDVLRVVDDQVTRPTFAGDLAEAILTLATTDAPGLGTFHCAAAGATSWHGFARTIFELAEPWNGPSPRVDPIPTSAYPTPAKRPANAVLDTDKLARTQGIALRPWTEGLAEMLARERRGPEGSIGLPGF